MITTTLLAAILIVLVRLAFRRRARRRRIARWATNLGLTRLAGETDDQFFGRTEAAYFRIVGPAPRRLYVVPRRRP